MIGNITLDGSERRIGNKYSFGWVCVCGVHGESTWSDLQDSVGTLRSCKACARRIYMQKAMQSDTWVDHQEKMTAASIVHNTKPKEWHVLYSIVASAKDRCTNPANIAYKNYGGRGIKFMFTSPTAAAEYIIEAIGYRPTPQHSIDRVDTNGDYAPGNIRWATRSEQMLNRRAWSNGPTGARIKKLQAQGVPFCHESIRTFIKQGLSDAEIINRVPSGSGRTRIRHS